VLRGAPSCRLRRFSARSGCFPVPVLPLKSRVLNYDDRPIPGLYGAGNCIASPAHDAYWAAGATLGSALTFGRLAGENAAREPVKEG
jgi:3-oxosteroid 1-dehydrogenase